MILWHDKKVIETFAGHECSDSNTLIELDRKNELALHSITKKLYADILDDEWRQLDAFLWMSMLVLTTSASREVSQALTDVFKRIKQEIESGNFFDGENFIHSRFCCEQHKDYYTTWSCHVSAALVLCSFLKLSDKLN